MQNNIYNFALRSNEINVDTLCEMCDMMEPDVRDRFVNAILGIVDYREVIDNLPKTAKIYDRENCRLVSVNYLTGNVRYEYDDVVVRYYKTEEEANRFIEQGRGRWDGNNKKDDEHPFEAVHIFHESSSCGINEWSK